MFAKYYLELPHPLEAVKAAMLDEPPENWLPGLVEAGSEFENRLLAEVGFSLGGRRLGQRVVVAVGRPAPLGAGLVIPFTWRATAREGLLPKLEADLELASLGRAMTQISVNARYDPPLAAVGRILDRALLHRVAEAVIRDFTERVGERVRRRLTAKTAAG